MKKPDEPWEHNTGRYPSVQDRRDAAVEAGEPYGRLATRGQRDWRDRADVKTNPSRRIPRTGGR